MKTKLSLLGIIASLSAVVTVSAQNTAVTKPVGYHTETVLGDAFTLLGINVGNSVAAAGDFDADSAQDDDVDFTTLLTADTPYTVQNLATGASASVTGFDANTLTTTLAVSDGDTYEIRQDATVASIFGANNEAGLGEGSGTDADIIWIPQADGSFRQIYRAEGNPGFGIVAEWKEVAEAGNKADVVIPFTAGIFIQRRAAAPLDIVFVGHVRTSATTVNLFADQFNFVNRVLPVGISLADSNIEEAPTWKAGSATDADILWLPDGAGNYNQYYYTEANPGFGIVARWEEVAVAGDKSSIELTAGYAVQKRGDSVGGPVTVAIPGDLDL
ncbi:MAG: hypothetical protein GY899_13315 [Verrucomicrobiaceae bacterium]|nr:hypothetical protein [Verrucomicrobiaceae bacterium]